MASRPKQPKYARNKNILVIGGSGSGKTRFFCKPSLLQAHSSYVCTDPKGTLLPEIGTFLERKKYRIKCLNLINFRKSMKYNPLAYIRSEKDRKGWIAAAVGVVGMCVNCQDCEAVGKLFADLWEKACLFPSGCEWLFHRHERQFSIFP